MTMPYKEIGDLPEAVQKALPPPAQAIYMAACNAALEQDAEDEETAAKVAWAAVGKKYQKGPAGMWLQTEKAAESAPPNTDATIEGAKPQKGHLERVVEAFAVSGVEPLGEGDYRIRFLTHGMTVDGRKYYPKRASEQAVVERVFDNAKMYFDHEGPGDRVRGNRSTRDWGATIKPGSVTATEGGIEAVAHAHSSSLREILDDPIAKENVGLSHDSYIRYSKSRINSKEVQVVEQITKCNSVDFVPAGNTNGRVLEGAAQEGAMTDMEMQELSEKLETLTGAVETIATQVKELATVKPPEAAPAAVDVDARVKEAIAPELAIRDAQIKVLQDEKAAATCLTLVREAVDARTDLTPVSKQRVVSGFSGQIIAPDVLVARVTEACNAERQYALDVLGEAGHKTRITGEGQAASPDATRATESYQADLKQHLQDSGYTPAEITKMLAVR
jgi:cation transport regulator